MNIDNEDFERQVGESKKLYLPWYHNDNGIIQGTPEDEESENYPHIADLAQEFGIEGPGDRFRADFIVTAANFVMEIARRKYDGEEMEGGTSYNMSNDDTHEALVDLITKAREILKEGAA